MQLITFAPGKKVLVSGKSYSVTGISDNDVVHLLSADSIERKANLETLHDWYQTGNLKPVKEDSSGNRRSKREDIKVIRRNENHSEKAKERGLVKKAYLKAVAENAVKIDDNDQNFKQVMSQVAAQYGGSVPCARSIYRWIKDIQFGSDESKFIPMWCLRGGKGKSRQHEEVQRLMEEVITNEYMTSAKKSINACHQILSARIDQLNQLRPASAQLKIPCRNTFERQIAKAYEGYEAYALRNSKSAADKKYRSSSRNTESWGFMQCVEVDHTPLDVMVIDKSSGLVLGRPRLTMMIEWKTRCCIGFTIGFEGTSTHTVLECVKAAVRHKGDIRERYPSIENEWPCWGMPQYLKLDNGSEFHSSTFRLSMAEMGIDLIYCPRKEAWFKGRVERLLKTVNHSLISTLPGATFTQLYNRVTGNDPSKYAVLDIETLREIIHIWVIDVYHQTYHSGIKSTPHKAWQRHFDLMKVALPGDPDMLEILSTELAVRTIQHYGIEMLETRTFNNVLLQELRDRKKFDKRINVKVRYNPQRLDRIWVYDEDECIWIEVKNSDPETSMLSTFQLSLVNQMRREEKKKTNGSFSLLRPIELIRQLIAPLMTSKKQRDQKKVMKAMGYENGSFAQLGTNKSSAAKSTKKLRDCMPSLAAKSKTSANKVDEDVIEKVLVHAIYSGDIEVFPCEPIQRRGVQDGW